MKHFCYTLLADEDRRREQESTQIHSESLRTPANDATHEYKEGV